jgi:hypothetical protein
MASVLYRQKIVGTLPIFERYQNTLECGPQSALADSRPAEGMRGSETPVAYYSGGNSAGPVTASVLLWPFPCPVR